MVMGGVLPFVETELGSLTVDAAPDEFALFGLLDVLSILLRAIEFDLSLLLCSVILIPVFCNFFARLGKFLP